MVNIRHRRLLLLFDFCFGIVEHFAVVFDTRRLVLLAVLLLVLLQKALVAVEAVLLLVFPNFLNVYFYDVALQLPVCSRLIPPQPLFCNLWILLNIFKFKLRLWVFFYLNYTNLACLMLLVHVLHLWSFCFFGCKLHLLPN